MSFWVWSSLLIYYLVKLLHAWVNTFIARKLKTCIIVNYFHYWILVIAGIMCAHSSVNELYKIKHNITLWKLKWTSMILWFCIKTSFFQSENALKFFKYTIADLLLALCVFTEVWSCVTKNLGLYNVYCIVDYFFKQLHTWVNTQSQ